MSNSGTSCIVACQASLSSTLSWSLLRFMSIESMMLPNHLILCCPLLFLQHQGLSTESALHISWPKYWCFSNSPSNEYSGLISFRIDYFDLLAAQGTLKSLLQHHNSTASSLWLSAFFMVQLAYRYTSTGTNHSFDYTDLCWQRDLSAF